MKQIYRNKHTNNHFVHLQNNMYKGMVVQFKIVYTNVVVCVVAKWCVLWLNGVCCGQVVCVVAEWCVLWPNGVGYGQVVWVVAE